MYKSDKAWGGYFENLKNQIKSAKQLSTVNYNLGEILALGQVSLSAKLLKSDGKLKKKTLKNRVNVTNYFIRMFLSCETQESLAGFLGIEIDWEEEKMTIKKFRDSLFQHILNLVMKREDPEFLQKAADAFVNQICEHYTGEKGE